MKQKNHDSHNVLHLAALIGIPYSYVAPLSYVRTNVQGTVNVLESVRKNNIELMINTSTSETYGTAIYKPIDEKHPLQGSLLIRRRKLLQINYQRVTIILLILQ